MGSAAVARPMVQQRHPDGAGWRREDGPRTDRCPRDEPQVQRQPFVKKPFASRVGDHCQSTNKAFNRPARQPRAAVGLVGGQPAPFMRRSRRSHVDGTMPPGLRPCDADAHIAPEAREAAHEAVGRKTLEPAAKQSRHLRLTEPEPLPCRALCEPFRFDHPQDAGRDFGLREGQSGIGHADIGKDVAAARLHPLGRCRVTFPSARRARARRGRAPRARAAA